MLWVFLGLGLRGLCCGLLGLRASGFVCFGLRASGL